MIESLLAPFQFPFMLKAFAIVVMIAVPAGLLSCFLVLKGWALMGDAISHAVLPGIVLAYIVGLPLALGAFLAGLGSALATGFLNSNSRVKSDTVMGVVFSGMFGLGIVLFTAIESDVHLDHVLFGNMLGVGRDDLLLTGGIATMVTVLLLLRWRDLLLLAFDPVQARTSGLRVGMLHYGLLAMLSATIVAMLSAVGVVLSVAILIAPGAIAFLVTRRFGVMLAAAVAVALGAGVVGVYASFFLDSAPGPTIVLTMTLLFILAFILRVLRIRQLVNSSAAG